MLETRIKDSFFHESEKLVQEVERNLLLLEEQPDDPTVIREVFRPFHTIKGNAGLAGEHDLQKLSQLAESVLDEVRQGLRLLDTTKLDALFATIDLIRDIVISKTSEPFQAMIFAQQEQLELILQSDDEPPRELVAETTTSAVPVIPELKCVRLIKTVTELGGILQRIRYSRNFSTHLHPAFEALLKTSLIVETERGLAGLQRRLKYLELYLTTLNRAVNFYDYEAWCLLDILYTDILGEMLPILMRNLNISTHYLNPSQSVEKLHTQLESARTGGASRFIVIINLGDYPDYEAIDELFGLHREYAPNLAFVQRSLGQKRHWRELGFLLPEAPDFWSTEWQALTEIA